jgi:KDO2-lipid IV(A) lauroyltransferase
MRENIEYLIVKLFLFIAKVTPKIFIYKIIKFFTLLVYRIDKNRRNITINNLKMAFPDKSIEDIHILSREVYVELSKTIAEILLMFTNRLDIDSMFNNLEEAKGQLADIIKRNKNGVIVVTAHFSNWELAAHFLAKHGLPMLAVGREGNNKLIDRKITKPFRNKYGNLATSKGDAMMAMVKRLKRGNAVGLLIDQKSGRQNSTKVNFFNEAAETTLSVAVLKSRLNPEVIPIFIAREDNGKYRLLVNDPISYTADEIEGKEAKLTAMTAKYTDAIEDVIRQYPAQWFWMHNRWRR